MTTEPIIIPSTGNTVTDKRLLKHYARRGIPAVLGEYKQPDPIVIPNGPNAEAVLKQYKYRGLFAVIEGQTPEAQDPVLAKVVEVETKTIIDPKAAVSVDEVKNSENHETPDLEYASRLTEDMLCEYAAQFGLDLGDEVTVVELAKQFKASVAPAVSEEEQLPKPADGDVPEGRKCPYCGSVARTDASYLKNHGKNCLKYSATNHKRKTAAKKRK